MVSENAELYNKSISLIIEHNKCSASFLQRKLNISYAMAGILIDELEENEIIGPHNGSKPREILI